MDNLGAPNPLSSPLTPPSTQPPLPAMRDFLDVDSARKNVFDGVLDGIKTRYPLENDNYILEIANPRYEGQQPFTLAQQKKAILSRANLDWKLKGTWRLKDKATGQVISEADKVIARVPYMTDRGTFIFRGNEYSVASQQRLKPGVYARQKDNNELESHVNLIPGTGSSFRLAMDPTNGVFKINIGQSTVPIYKLLKTLGVTDREVSDSWGPELYQTNALKDKASSLDKIYTRLANAKIAKEFSGNAEAGIRAIFQQMRLDPEVSSRNLGQPFEHVDGKALLRATQKLMHIHQGKEESDDRDSQANQILMAVEDIFRERVTKDAGQHSRKLLWRASNTKRVDNIPSSALSTQVYSALLSSGLGQCFDKETLVLTDRGFIKWPEVSDRDRFACMVNGVVEFHLAKRVIRELYCGPMYGVKTKRVSYLVTPNHRVYSRTPKFDAAYSFSTAVDVFGKGRRVMASLGKAVVDQPADTRVLTWTENRWNKELTETVSLRPWIQFLGWWLAEGSAMTWSSKKAPTCVEHRVTIAQSHSSNPKKCEVIKRILESLPFNWRYSHGGNEFVIRHKGLFQELAHLRGCANKRIPRYVFDLPDEYLHLLLDAYTCGDGRVNPLGHTSATTTSYGLAIDLVELLGRLGMTGRISESNLHLKNKNWNKAYVVSYGNDVESIIVSSKDAITAGKPNPHFTQEYADMVYCAEVPGGLLYVLKDGKPHWSGNSLTEVNPIDILDQLTRVSRLGEGGIGSSDSVPNEARNVQPSQVGFVDFVRGPESNSIGVDARFALGTYRGADNQLYRDVINARTGKPDRISARTAVHSVFAFPGELEPVDGVLKPKVRALVDGKIKFVSRQQVDYALPHGEHMFGVGSNLVPMLSGIKGGRLLMGGKFSSQALALKNPEAPLVQSMSPEGESYEHVYGGKMGVVRTKTGGVVTSVTPDEIVVRGHDGKTITHQVYNNFPFNQKSQLHSTPTVKMGEAVQPNQLLARSNYTDDKGTLALGTNLRVAYLPYSGSNYEDAWVISEGAAKRLSSEHMTQHKYDVSDGREVSRKSYLSTFPSKYNRDQLNSISDDGVVKAGTVVRHGDPLILAVNTRKPQRGAMLHRSSKSYFADDSQVWEGKNDGVVTDVWRDDDGVKVAVKHYAAMTVGDKLSNRQGGKGVVGKIIPDDQMPHDSEGRPFELLANPQGVVSRTNPSVLAEVLLAKVARKTGQPYKIRSFNVGDIAKFAFAEARKHGVTEDEKVYDPDTNRWLPGIGTGEVFMMKLYHTAECYDDQTEVLTRRGWVNWASVMSNDQLATVENGTLIYESPLSLTRSEYQGDLYCFSGRYVDYAVTPNHRMYVCNAQGEKRFEFKRADEVHNTRFCVHQYGFTPDHPTEDRTFAEINGLRIGWDDYCELIGWYLSEGYVRLDRLNSVTILYQSQAANPDKFAILESLVTRLPFNKWHYYRVNGIKMGIGISSRPLAEHLVLCGRRQQFRRIPREILDGSVSGRVRLYESMMLGDGNFQITASGPHASYSTTSNGLADDFQELCIRIGAGAVVRRDKQREGNCLPSWTVGISLNRTIAQVDPTRGTPKFSTRNYRGFVYCATMRTGLLYVRRNGKPMLCGNSKESGRDVGGYTSEGQPAKGGSDGAKRIGGLDLASILSHNAPEVLKDAKLIRGQRNDQFWNDFRTGKPYTMPGSPPIYSKFMAHLKGAGINLDRRGDRTHMMALTDADITKMSRGEITSADAVDSKNNEPIAGGSFDVGITGGHYGNGWSHISLSEPVLNPVMEEPARRLLGLTKPAFEELLRSPNGGNELQRRLSSINVDSELLRQREAIKSGKKSKRDEAVKLLGYLDMMKRMGIKPEQFLWSKVPVIPPAFRPVSLVDGMQLTSDANLLYKDVFEANKNLKELSQHTDDLGDERVALYKSIKAAAGLGDPISVKLQDKKVAGLLEHVFGKGAPKLGMYQRRVLANPVDVVGRSTIVPDPNLDMDQVGIPESKAWTVYQPFIMRNLARKYNSDGGHTPMTELTKWIANKDPRAKTALFEEMKTRPVLVNRAPVLHKFGFMAAWPVITAGDTLRISPINTAGFGADFDGDQQINQVFLLLPDKIFSSDLVQWRAKEIPMPSYFNTAVSSLDANYHLVICDLKDVPHGELIGTRDHIDFYHAAEGIKVVALDEHSHTPVLADVHGWSVHRDRLVEIVTLTSGRQIITDDDERAVYGVDIDSLLWCRRRPSEASRQMVPVLSNALVEVPLIHDIALSEGDSRLHERLILNQTSGYLIGLMVGNGWTTYSGGVAKDICLSTSYSAIQTAFTSALGMIFKQTPNVGVRDITGGQFENSKGSTTLVVSSMEAGRFMSTMIGNGAQNKHLPQICMAAPREFQIGLLAGLWDTDGSMSFSNAKGKPQFMVNYTSSSITLLQQMQHLLRTLGVTATISATETPAGRDFWILNVSSPDFWRFGPLPLNSEHKMAVQARFFAGERPGSKGGSYNRNKLVPMPSVLAIELRRVVRHIDNPNLYSVLHHANSSGVITKEAARRVISYMQVKELVCTHPLFSRWEELVDSSINFEAVVDVNKTNVSETGYDLTVPGFETFMSVDGIILSNTMNYQVPVSDAAVKQAIEKMMPSSNLKSPATFDVHMLPRQEFLFGLHSLVKKARTDRQPRIFATIADAITAYRSGGLDADHPVIIQKEH